MRISGMATQAPANTNEMPSRSRAQIWAEGALAPHPYRLELRGSPAHLAWPEICAHCGNPATQRIVVKKVFRPLPRRHGSSGGLRAYRIGSASIPFCGNCRATHEATVRRPSVAKKALHLILNPLIIPILGFAWLTTIFVKQAPLPDVGRFPGWIVYVLLAAALAWCVFVLWRSTGPSRLDPQTDITRACDFSEDVGGWLEKERRIYALSNKSFADRMAAMNADRVWTAGDQSRSTKVQFVLAVLMLAGLAAIAGLVKLMGN
jgi:hypothetical protein